MIALLLCFGCSSSGQKMRPKNTNVGEVYRSAGYQEYLLPDLPSWAQFSQNGECAFTEQLKWVDPWRLQAGQNLRYDQAVQFQILFNQLILEEKLGKNLEELPLPYEEKIFMNALERVRSNLGPFKAPDFKTIYLVWIDPLTKDMSGKRKLKKFLKSSIFDEGYPVLLSSCLNTNGMTNLVKELGIDALSMGLLPREAILLKSNVNASFPITTNQGKFFKWELDLAPLFEEGSTIRLYLPRGYQLNEYSGFNQVRTIR
jgi:hypothetical protein